MPEHERAIDEFESIFERSHVPVPDITRVSLDRVLVALDFGKSTPGLTEIAKTLSERFSSRLLFVLPIDVPESALDTAKERGEALLQEIRGRFPEAEAVLDVGPAAAALAARIATHSPSMALIPAPFRHFEGEDRGGGIGNVAETLLDQCDLPILIVREGSRAGADLFDRVLAVIPGPFDLVGEFDLAFTLCVRDGKLMLLHVIDEEVLAQFADAFQLSAEVETGEGRDELIAGLERKMQVVLKGAQKAGEDWPFAIIPAIEIGNPVAVCRRYIKQEGVSAIIVRTRTGEGRGQPEAQAFELVRVIDEVPVIAL